jgi:hypothetical protein
MKLLLRLVAVLLPLLLLALARPARATSCPTGTPAHMTGQISTLDGSTLGPDS